ncbi:hypothetical protein C0Z19_00845 [Trinickia soli]|uniref:Uncharacterized protein n=1 Tax=Trinickia soli TaxID=380675 RepID=A0A2N7WG65_9BURK|nr:hypothetical protein C0Z19_00845 [Trinickia soli]
MGCADAVFTAFGCCVDEFVDVADNPSDVIESAEGWLFVAPDASRCSKISQMRAANSAISPDSNRSCADVTL